MTKIDANSWYYSPDHGQLCKVIETQSLWGDTTCRVWLPGSDSVVRIPAANLKPLEDTATGTPEQITYVAAAARVADALTQDVLLAPIESSVTTALCSVPTTSRASTHPRQCAIWEMGCRFREDSEYSFSKRITSPAALQPKHCHRFLSA